MNTFGKNIICLFITFVVFSLSGCDRSNPYYEESGSVFHTLYKIKYQAPKLLTEEIDAELAAVNLSLNPYNPNSIIAKVNNNEPVEVDEHFTTVFNKAMEISENSNGAFDITAGPVINVWGFGPEKMDHVSPEIIDSLKQIVGYRKIRLEGKQIIKEDPRIKLNASAIAKGYACDVVAKLLERRGVKNYMVFIGGEVSLKGVNDKGQPWHIAIRKPEDVEIGKTATITTEDTALISAKKGVATSGDYLNFYIKDGKKYAHTINPKTGYPAEQNILSCTIVADDCMTADAYATALMVMGSDEAVRVADNLKAFDYFLIYTDQEGAYKLKYSDGMKQYLLKHGTGSNQ